MLTAPNGEEVAKGTAEVSAAGGFDIALDLPADMALGSAWPHADAPAASVRY